MRIRSRNKTELVGVGLIFRLELKAVQQLK